jgi:hypothetical protein
MAQLYGPAARCSAWMSSEADSRVAYPGRDSSVSSKLLQAK